MITNKIVFALSCLLLSSCSHSIKFANNHFAVPVTSENTGSGHISAAATGVTEVKVLNDMTSNPPRRERVIINEGVDGKVPLLLNSLGVNGSLGIIPSLEVLYNAGTWGLRWQFLNHGVTPDQWVAAFQVGYGTNEQSSSVSGSTGTDSAKSEVKSRQAALSVGYRFAELVPYMSYVLNAHEVKTQVQDAGGLSFGPYEDKGDHQSISWGVTSYKKGVDYGFEATLTKIDWQRSVEMGQFSVGGKIGYAW